MAFQVLDGYLLEPPDYSFFRKIYRMFIDSSGVKCYSS